MVAKYLPNFWGLDSMGLFLFMKRAADCKIQTTILMLRQVACSFPETLWERHFSRLRNLNLSFYLFHMQRTLPRRYGRLKPWWALKSNFKLQAFYKIYLAKFRTVPYFLTDGEKHFYIRSPTKQESKGYLRNGQ